MSKLPPSPPMAMPVPPPEALPPPVPVSESRRPMGQKPLPPTKPKPKPPISKPPPPSKPRPPVQKPPPPSKPRPSAGATQERLRRLSAASTQRRNREEGSRTENSATIETARQQAEKIAASVTVADVIGNIKPPPSAPPPGHEEPPGPPSGVLGNGKSRRRSRRGSREFLPRMASEETSLTKSDAKSHGEATSIAAAPSPPRPPGSSTVPQQTAPKIDTPDAARPGNGRSRRSSRSRRASKEFIPQIMGGVAAGLSTSESVKEASASMPVQPPPVPPMPPTLPGPPGSDPDTSGTSGGTPTSTRDKPRRQSRARRGSREFTPMLASQLESATMGDDAEGSYARRIAAAPTAPPAPSAGTSSASHHERVRSNADDYSAIEKAVSLRWKTRLTEELNVLRQDLGEKHAVEMSNMKESLSASFRAEIEKAFAKGMHQGRSQSADDSADGSRENPSISSSKIENLMREISMLRISIKRKDREILRLKTFAEELQTALKNQSQQHPSTPVSSPTRIFVTSPVRRVEVTLDEIIKSI